MLSIVGACPHDCPDTCATITSVVDGRATQIRGARDHPVTQGFLCAKVNRYLERTYHPDRLQHPLRRVGAKGEGRFETTTWAEAIEAIAGGLREVIDHHGPQSVLPYSYAGTMGMLQRESMSARFFHRLGTTVLDRTICATAGTEGWNSVYGPTPGPGPEDVEASRLMLLWGTNTLTSNPHLWPALRRARERGGRIVCIDPVNTRTARASDLHLAPRPGTDAALALGMIRVLLDEGLTDEEFLAERSVGWDLLRERILGEWTARRAADICDVPVEDIVALAIEYGSTTPTYIRLNFGMQRHAGGGSAIRAVALLPAVTGAWRHPGGGAMLSTGGAFAFNKAALQRPDWIPPGTRHINMNRLGEALTQPDAGVGGPPIQALVVYNANPAAVAPDLTRVRDGLRREDLLTVVIEQFPTDTVDYADWVLPATTQLEHLDVHSSYGHPYATLNRPAVAPLGEALPNTEVFRRLAAGMGLSDPEFAESDDELIDVALRGSGPTMAPVTRAALERDGWVRVDVDALPTPAAGRLPTPTGRIQCVAPELADVGLDPIPDYVEPREVGQVNPRLPLALLSPPEHGFLNSTFANVAPLAKAAGEPMVHLHPDDAAVRGIVAGMPVRVANDRGAFVASAAIDDVARPGTAVSYGVRWARRSPGGHTVNDTTSMAVADLGGGATFYDNAVEVEPWPDGVPAVPDAGAAVSG